MHDHHHHEPDHKAQEHGNEHDKQAGHSVEMFKSKFWHRRAKEDDDMSSFGARLLRPNDYD
jgi:hypothetical protein